MEEKQKLIYDKISKEQYYLKQITPLYRYLPLTIFGVIFVLIVFIFLLTANASLPGDFSYPVEKMEEDITLTFTFDDYKKTQLYYQYANERFIEYQIVSWEIKIYGSDANHILKYSQNETLNAVTLAFFEIDKYIKNNPNADNEINREIVLMKKKLIYIQDLISKNEIQQNALDQINYEINVDNKSKTNTFELID